MGTLTFEQLQNEVRFGLGGRTDQDSRLAYLINVAQRRLARIHDFDEMKTITTTSVSNTGSTNDKFLTLPNKREVYSVSIINGSESRKLVNRTPQFFDRLITMPEYWSRDIPTDYIVWNNTIEIYPLPSATYTVKIRWTKWPTDLSASTDVSEFLAADDAIIEMTLAYILRSLGKEDDALKHERQALMLIGEATSVDTTNPDLNIGPSISDAQAQQGGIGQPWIDPFVRDN